MNEPRSDIAELHWPAPNGPTILVTLTRGLMLGGRGTRTKINRGETISLDLDEGTHLIDDGYAVRQGDAIDLDETLIVVSVKAPFRFRGVDFRVEAIEQVPAWFATKARADGRVGDPPVPEEKPELSAAVKAAIENRRIQRQRKIAHDYLESLT